jgi:Uma2 family endonuclease
MSAVLAPNAPSTGRVMPLKWTVEDFHNVGETGIFEGRRPILLRGVILELGPMKTPHAVAVELATDALRAVVPHGYRVRAQLPLVLSLDTDPMPDLAVVAGSPRDSLGNHPTTAPLVIEISDTSLDTDITDKAELYATAGIADYWVLDLESRQLLIFRDPVPLPAGLGTTAYCKRLAHGPADTVTPLAFPAAAVKVADLLP